MADTGDRILVGLTVPEAEMIVTLLDQEWAGLDPAGISGPLQDRIQASLDLVHDVRHAEEHEAGL